MAHTYNEILVGHKKETNLSHATAWINLKDMILSEISQTQKDKYCMIPLN